ncbi:MAG: YhcH/YjgK/YiaL family protein [Marinilabiliales bacterium]|nr:YhcH/YjgK/YiaL family protein [Marinilabiliales bacterium]
MVLDNIENAGRYMVLGEGIAAAFQYIQQNDLKSVPAGKYVLDGDKLLMNVFEFEATNLDECKLEGHRKYIDLQYWVVGSELMGHEILDQQPVITPYNEETDCGFYKCLASYSRLDVGMFVIYFPTDLHTAVADPLCDGKVKKIVFKIRVA